MSEKFVFIITTGMENPEKFRVALNMANTAVASDFKTSVILQMDSVLIANKHLYEGLSKEPCLALKTLIQSLIEEGAKIWVCSGCAIARGMSKEEDLIDGVNFIGQAKILEECSDAKVINY